MELFDGGKRKHFDFYGFFGRFKDEVMSDELYLGYYFHLIEDNLFRYYLYYIKGLLSRRGDTELTARLYMDYHILNRKLVEKYGFENKPAVPENFAEEKINSMFINIFIGEKRRCCYGTCDCGGRQGRRRKNHSVRPADPVPV